MRAIKYKICLQPTDWFVAVASLSPRLVPLGGMLLAGGPALAEEVDFKRTTCWFSTPRDRDMSCGHLTVPENCLLKTTVQPLNCRLSFSSHISKGMSLSSICPAVPVNLQGSRAGVTLKNGGAFSNTGAWLRGRRFVVLDLRGVGLSEPSLGCSKHHSPKVWNNIVSHPDDRTDFDLAQKSEVLACREDLIGKGIDLAAYNTREIAADIHDLRVALNIDKWICSAFHTARRLPCRSWNSPAGNIAACSI